MTITPETRTAVEDGLAKGLRQVAETFFADLRRQGHLVEAGGAAELDRLRGLVETRRSHTSIYQAAVDTIVSDCSYTRVGAMRIADVLNRAGLLADDGGPDPQHDRAPAPAPAAPLLAGAIVVPRPARPVHDDEEAPAWVRVGKEPQQRPAAAVDTGGPEQTSEFRVEWSPEYAKAVTVAAKLQAAHASRTELSSILADGQRVAAVIKAASLDDWEYWLTAIGAPLAVQTHIAGYAQLAVGSVDGVAVHLTAHEIPRLIREAAASAREAFHLWGRVYDLASGYRDRYDNVWVYLGQRQESGMPLMLLRGTEGPLYSFGSIITSNGPLAAIELPAAAPAVPATGGEG
ncbi:BN159_2729 family protein [Streptomyces fagopyri]|uniref:BN159_2729 family protein n=1 Tax=Streptomyces fagopyri TaxID=2662397 RepID=UPI0036A81A96